MVMNTLMATTFVSGFFYNLFVDSTYLIIYMACLLLYTAFTQGYLRDMKDHTKRKAIIIATWSHPTDPA